jgi:O-antigen/teichoic acid export membrane protein
MVIIRKSFPYAVLILLMGFYTRIDAVMLERILSDGATHAGIYAQSFRLLDAVNMVAYLFAALLLPIFSYMIKQKENVDELVKIAIMLLVVPSFIVSTGCFLFRYEIMNLLYNSTDYYNVTVFGILIFGFIAFGTTYIFGTLLTANGSLKELNIIASCALVLNIILNFILIPRFQAIGSAVVCIAVQTFPAIAQIFVAAKIFKLRILSKNIIKAALFVVILIITGYFVEFYKDNLQISWYYIFGIYGGAMLVVAILLKLFRIKGLFKIISLKKEDSL